jgi:hypothetical protein
VLPASYEALMTMSHGSLERTEKDLDLDSEYVRESSAKR